MTVNGEVDYEKKQLYSLEVCAASFVVSKLLSLFQVISLLILTNHGGGAKGIGYALSNLPMNLEVCHLPDGDSLFNENDIGR